MVVVVHSIVDDVTVYLLW